jgi:hypothetical protein
MTRVPHRKTRHLSDVSRPNGEAVQCSGHRNPCGALVFEHPFTDLSVKTRNRTDNPEVNPPACILTLKGEGLRDAVDRSMKNLLRHSPC